MSFVVDIVNAVGSAIGAVVGAVTKVIGFVVKTVGSIFGFGVKKPKTAASTVNNLTKSIDPEASRKIVFGQIAAPLDCRFWEVWGSDDTNFDEVIAVATHRIQSYEELYIENDLAINAAGTVQTKFSGSLTRTTANGNQSAALSVGSGSLWTSTAKFDGCAHFKLSWVVDEKKLPNGVPNRYTQVVKGALVYDPRKDTTVGGSGTHRANNQATWAYATLDSNGQPIGRNNALQMLWYLLGWRIANAQTGELMLVAGRGVDPNDINMASFIAAANACEAAGYYTDMCLSTDDEHTANEDKISCGGLIGRLIDPGGYWSYYANVNDTASIAVDLTDDDVLDIGAISWQEYKGMSEQFNQVAGKYINADSISLYQPFPYPMVRDATYEANLGRKVRKTQDFPQVLDVVLAQRLARLKVNEGQYQGEFQAVWSMKALKAQAWSVVRYTSTRFGWVKLFRVWRYDINPMGGITMLLKEIDASIWTAGTTANATSHAVGSRFDLSLTNTVLNFTVQNITVSSGSPALVQDAMSITWTLPPSIAVDRTELRYKIGTGEYIYLPYISRDVGLAATMLVPVAKGASYTLEARHINRNGLAGAWASVTLTAGIAGNWVTANSTVISKIDPLTGRVSDPTMYNTQMIMGIENTTNIDITYTVGGSNVTVNIPLHTRKIADASGALTITYNAGSFVVPFSSYWIAYIDDPTLTGDTVGVVNYVYTTNPDDLLMVNRYFVASGTSPSAGGTGGTAGGGGGGGYGGGSFCVFVDSFMPSGLRANQIMQGDQIEIMNESFDGFTFTTVEKNRIGVADCVKLTSITGIELICSKTTPLTLRDNSAIFAPEAFGHDLPVRDEDGFRWEKIIKVENVGMLPVAYISCYCEVYAAGNQPGRYIYTHNIYPIKP
jgi:hypothetical protein